MWDGRRLKSRAQSDPLGGGDVRKGEVDCGKGEKSRVAMCISD
jgi:hypothetical protein